MTIDLAHGIVGPAYPPQRVGYRGAEMSRSKRIVALSALEPGELSDCFALLIERKPGTTSAGKRFFTCRFRDNGRTVTHMVWADGGRFDECQSNWQTDRYGFGYS
jgi:hypothetical protein